jgi:myo-inositol-1(or 4)-monophosphatase
MSELEGLLRVAKEAALAAGRLQQGRPHDVRLKGAVNLVTEVDLASEAAIREILEREVPGVPVLAEEGGGAWHATTRWIVDPLDGTTNFVHGYPAYGPSIALQVEGSVVVACVHDAATGQTCSATRGGGAFLDGIPIVVSHVGLLSESLLATGFPYDRRLKADFYLSFVKQLLVSSHCLRRSGSAAVDLCHVGRGMLDGFWEYGLRPWDVAAGSLIVAEAGGRVTNMDGSPLELDGANIVATNSRIHDQVVEAIQTVLASIPGGNATGAVAG